MPPDLYKTTFDGASQHRLKKGLILIGDDGHPVHSATSTQIRDTVQQRMYKHPLLEAYTLETARDQPALFSLITPFMPVYTVIQRNNFIERLVAASSILLEVARHHQCRLVTAGVNPYQKEGDEQASILCADIHQIEVYDEGEIERIYNLYRQFLPELLAISTNSGVYGQEVQTDSSLRMRVNQSSFLPRYISQFDARHLDNLETIMRRDHGLANLRQMDINPLEGRLPELQHLQSPLSGIQTAAIEIRFLDAQSSFPFIRAQLLLLQAIAMAGRSLARKGKRLPHMKDTLIDENKALALQDGPAAILKPALDYGKGITNGKPANLFHDKKEPTIATSALLMDIEGMLLPRLQHLECEPWELYPILLGAELRHRGKPCFANYAEYFQYLCRAQKEHFAFYACQQSEQLLTSSTFDIISDYNRELCQESELREIEHYWENKLRPRQRPPTKIPRATQQAPTHGQEQKAIPPTEEMVLEIQRRGPIQVICDLRQTSAAVNDWGTLQTYWQKVNGQLIARPVTPGKALEVKLETNKLTLWVVDPQGHTYVERNAGFVIVDVMRNPALLYHCRCCQKYGPLRCNECIKENRPEGQERLCASCAYTVTGKLSVYCPDHKPRCACRACNANATFACTACMKMYAKHMHHTHPKNDNIDYCFDCYQKLFIYCVPCQQRRGIAENLGKLRCAYKTRFEKVACGTGLCWEHAQQWKIWGPYNRGIIFCEHHRNQLGITALADILTMMITERPPQSGGYLPLTHALRLQRILSRIYSNPVTFLQIAEGLNELGGQFRQRNEIQLQQELIRVIANELHHETNLLQQVKMFYQRMLGIHAAENILDLDIIPGKVYPKPGLVNVQIRLKQNNKRLYIGQDGVRIQEICTELKIHYIEFIE